MKFRVVLLALFFLNLTNAFCDIIKDFHNIEVQYEKARNNKKSASNIDENYLAVKTCELFKSEIEKSEKNAWFSENKENIKKALGEKHSNGFSPIFYAIQTRNCKLAEKMLQYGADLSEKVNSKKYDNLTPLLFACMNSDFDTIDFILKNTTAFDVQGTVKNEKNKIEMQLTPIQYLSNFYDKQKLILIQKLLEKGANVESTFFVNDEVKTAFFCAIASEDEDFYEIVLPKVSARKIDTKVTIKIKGIASGERPKRFSGFFTGTALSYACSRYNQNKKNPIFWSLIERLVVKGADVNSKAFYGTNEVSPLLLLCMNTERLYSIKDEISKFISLGADMNLTCKLENWTLTPFHFVSKYADNQTADIFLVFKNYDADMNKKDSLGKTAFDYMAMHQKNSADKIEFWYMQKGNFNLEDFDSTFVNVNYSEKTSNGELSILQVAIKNKDETTALKLLEKNLVNWKENDVLGKNAFDYAVEIKSDSILNYFLEKKIHIEKSIFSLVNSALENGEIEYLNKFLSEQDFKTATKRLSDVNLNANTTEEVGPIVFAALKEGVSPKNKENTIKTLILHKDKISDKGLNEKVIKGGKTPLLFILEKYQDSENIAIELLNFGANLEVRDNSGISAKDIVFRKNASQIINWMLKNKIPLGDSIFAAIDNELEGHNSFLEDFLSEKVFENESNSKIISGAMTYSVEKDSQKENAENRIKILTTLLKAGYPIDEKIVGGERNGDTAFLLSVKNSNTEVAKFLLEKGADLDAENNGSEPGKTAIFYALEQGNSKITEEIISNKNFKAKDIQLANEQVSFLMYLSRYGTFQQMNSILPKIVSTNENSLERKDKDGLTPFLYAAKYNGDYRIMSLLRMYGAKADATDNKGNNAKVLAEQNPNSEVIIKRLENYGVY